jgi:deoxyribodipyrimidine photolyase
VDLYLKADMTLIRRLAWRLGQELVRRPEARAKAKEVLAETQRVLNDDVKPRAKQAWRDAQPGIETAKRKLKSFAEEFREEYRKGRDGD